MSNDEQCFWAGALFNGVFFCVETYSGLGLIGRDLLGAQHLLGPDSEDEELGEALADALSKSRTLTLDEYGEFFDYKKGEIQHKDWLKTLMERYCYKTKRAMFKNMKSCNIESQNGTITIRPSHHEKLEAWSGDGISESDYVVIPADSSPAEIGAALRLAFSRCT